jgi:hypothetical protein
MATANNTLNSLLNEHDVARITGLSVATVRRYRLLRQGPKYLKLDAAVDGELRAEVQKVETEVSSPHPNHSVLEESLRTIRTLLEGCAGSLISSGLIYEIGKLVK